MKKLLTGSLMLGSFLIAGTAFAAGPGMMGNGMMRIPGVIGKVATINGTTLTVTTRMMVRDRENEKATTAATSVTYTVDASKATVLKNNATSTVAAIAVGDTIAVQGAMTGTSIVATTIRDGFITHGQMMGRGDDEESGPRMGSSSPMMSGNGQPIIGGSITAVSGTTLTVTNKSNVTYTVDVTSATVTKAGAASTVAAVAVGDSVIVQGSVNGTAVIATTVIDSGAPAATPGRSDSTEKKGGFFHGMGNFFHNFFGFF